MKILNPAIGHDSLLAGHADGLAIDLDDAAWMPPREVPNRDTVRAWAAGREGRNIAGFLVITR